MRADVYEDERQVLLAAADGIQTVKRPGYVLGNEDVLHNFKSVAERVGITVGQVWAVYALKHVDAITTLMCRPDLPVAEAPIGRFADLINYAQLGWAILRERETEERAEAAKALTEQAPVLHRPLGEDALFCGEAELFSGLGQFPR